MTEVEGDLDIMKQPIVIDNVSSYLVGITRIMLSVGVGTDEGWNEWRLRAITDVQLIVSVFHSI